MSELQNNTPGNQISVLSAELENNDNRPPKKQKIEDNVDITATYMLSKLHVYVLQHKNQELSDLLRHESWTKIIDIPDAVGNSPLHLSSGDGNAKGCSILLEHGANPNVQNINGLTAAHLAIRHNYPQCLKTIIESKRIPVNLTLGNKHAITPIHLAAKYGRVQMADMILLHCNHSKEVINCKDSWGQTPLHYAVIHDKLECVEYLCTQHAEIDIKDDTGMTPLLSAASVGNIDIVQLLVNHGADLKMKNNSGKTVIHLALLTGKVEFLDFILNLIRSKFDEPFLHEMINAKDHTGVTALVETTQKKTELCDILKKFGAQDGSPEEMEILCSICQTVLWNSVTLACGHSFCRSCIQNWRRQNDSCPNCRTAVRLVGGYTQNMDLQKVVSHFYSSEVQMRDSEEKRNALDRAIDNIIILGKMLNVDIVLDKHNTAVLSIDGQFPLHLTFMTKRQMLFMYAPLLSKFPADSVILTKIYELVLSHGLTCFGRGNSGVGMLTRPRKVLLMYVGISMEYADSNCLKKLITPFVLIVKKWRLIIKDILLGQQQVDDAKITEVSSITLPCVANNAGKQAFDKNIQAFEQSQFISSIKVVDPVSDGKYICIAKDATGQLETKVSIWYDNLHDLICVMGVVKENFKVGDSPAEIDKYELFLQAAAFGFKTADASIGITENDEKQSSLVMRAKVEMIQNDEHEFSDQTLIKFIPEFVTSVSHWISIFSK